MMQIIGNTSNIYTTTAIALLDRSDDSQRQIALAYIIGLANIIDKKSLEWVNKTLVSIAKGQITIDAKQFGSNVFNMKYQNVAGYDSIILEVLPYRADLAH